MYAEPELLVPRDIVPPEFPLIPGDYVIPPKCAQPAQTVDDYCEDVSVPYTQQPQFEGVINGIRLYTFLTARYDPSVERKSCEIHDFPLVEELTFEFLPPGTYAEGPQFAAECEDGSFSLIMRMFGDFKVIFFSGDRALAYEATVDRVTTGVIQGKEAVVIVPHLELRRQSWVAFATDNGFISVESHFTSDRDVESRRRRPLLKLLKPT